jgi:acetyl esterase/lipase
LQKYSIGVDSYDLYIPASEYEPTARSELIVRVHEPKTSAIPACALLYFHGGSGVAGNVFASSGLAMRYAFESQCFIYSVQYRLAPEFRNPIPIMDAYASVKWLVDRAGAFGVDS